MPNTLTTIFRSTPGTEPVEAPHPNTGAYVTGTQLADGTWSVVHTAITKTASPLTMVGRLKNFPAITASIVASGNILNNPQPAPTNTSATGSSSTSINITGSSGANATAYRFLSASAQAGPYTVLVTQASASYAHTGLAAGVTVWYQMQYVGGGFYDDSPVSAGFSGVTSAATPPVTLTVTPTNLAYNSRNLANNGGTQYDALAEFTILTNSANLAVNVYGFNEAGYSLNIADVWVNGVEFVGGVPGTFATATTGAATYQLTGLPITAGTPLSVKFTFSGQQNYAGTRPLNSYVSLTSVVVPSGFSGSIVTPVAHPAELIYVYGDSTTQYNGAFSWDKVLNRSYRTNADIFVTGASALAGGVALATATAQTALLADYKATRAQGSYTKGRFWFDSMVNDCYFNSYTPSQLNGFYTAFAQMFLADAALANDTLYFKSAIPNTAHGTDGLNGMTPTAYRLSDYRTAMANAVTSVASPRVLYADGTQLQKAQYLVDGTHVNRDGDAYIAGTINALINSAVSSTTFTTSASQQAVITVFAAGGNGSNARALVATSTSGATVEWSFNGGTYGSSNIFSLEGLSPAVSTVTYAARLFASPATIVSNTFTLAPYYAPLDTAGLTLVGTGWQRGTAYVTNGPPYAFAYSDLTADYAQFTVPAGKNYKVEGRKQLNIATLTKVENGGAAATVSVTGTGYDSNMAVLVQSTAPAPAGGLVVRLSCTSGQPAFMFSYVLIY